MSWRPSRPQGHPPLEGEGRLLMRMHEQSGWGDSLSIINSVPAERSPHPGTHLASLDRVPTLPLQGRVKGQPSRSTG